MRAKSLLIAGGVLVLAAGAAVWAGRDTYSTARIGTAYVAKQTCSCLFVAGRSMDSCRTDYEAEAIEPLAIDASASGVKVSALGGLIAAQAQFERGFGCHLLD